MRAKKLNSQSSILMSTQLSIVQNAANTKRQDRQWQTHFRGASSTTNANRYIMHYVDMAKHIILLGSFKFMLSIRFGDFDALASIPLFFSCCHHGLWDCSHGLCPCSHGRLEGSHYLVVITASGLVLTASGLVFTALWQEAIIRV